MQWCSVFNSVIEQESAEVSREIRVPWSHLAAVPASCSHCPQLKEKRKKNSEEFKMYDGIFFFFVLLL